MLKILFLMVSRVGAAAGSGVSFILMGLVWVMTEVGTTPAGVAIGPGF